MDGKEKIEINSALSRALENYGKDNTSEIEDDKNTPTFFKYLFNNGTNTSVASIFIVIANIINPILMLCSESYFFIFATVVGWYLVAPFWLFANVFDYKTQYKTQKARTEKGKGILLFALHCLVLLVFAIILECTTPKDSTGTNTYTTTHSSIKCDLCGSKNASSYTDTNSAGQVQHYNLCSDCYSKVKKAADALNKIQ